jgi:hypothetical protein
VVPYLPPEGLWKVRAHIAKIVLQYLAIPAVVKGPKARILVVTVAAGLKEMSHGSPLPQPHCAGVCVIGG